MKFLKKHFTKFIMAFTLAFTSLFVAFGCITFASPGYEIQGDGVSIESLNLLNPSYILLGYTTNNDGVPVPASYDRAVTNFMPISSGTYTISAFNGMTIAEVNFADSNRNGLGFHTVATDNYTFSVPSNASYIIILFKKVDGSSMVLDDITNNYMLNEGNEALDYFPYWFGVNANTYNQLEDSYNTIQNDYNNLKNRYNYGFFANLTNFRMVASNNGVQVIDDSYDLQDLINLNLFSNGTFLLDNFIISNNNTTYTNAFIKIDFAPNLVASNVDLIFVGSYAFNFPFTITLANNESINFNITNENNIISHTELNNFSVINGNSPIANFKILFDYNQYIPNINYNTDYSYAYNTGFSDGQNASYTIINQLDKQINDLNSQVANMSNTINTLQIAYNDLNTSYENMLNGNNFANLFFTIAETPFASFKQIWNVDFLGVNLAGFVTGILFLGLIIWVIKKIF